MSLLETRDVVVDFPTSEGRSIRAVDHVSISLEPGETLGIVGESGCGKSTLARAILQLVRPTSGSVLLKDLELTGLKGRELRSLRKQMQMVFQDPRGCLDPRMSVGALLTEPLRVHKLGASGGRKHRAQEMLERIGLDSRFMSRRPADMSGGQQQRVAIGRALITNPELVICDEPVSALDVSIQAQVINLLGELQRDLGVALIFIAHDLAVVRHISDRVAVMYLGRIVEEGPTDELFQNPRHPYTQGLIASIPQADSDARIRLQNAQRLAAGDLPSLLDPPSGCAYRTRCAYVQESCSTNVPLLREVPKTAQRVACDLWEEIQANEQLDTRRH